MKLKKTSLALLIILALALAFILGLRRGQQVEKTNKIIDYLISIPPTATVQPTQLPLEFKMYENEVCGIKFLYPSSLSVVNLASNSARLNNNITTDIALSCSSDNQDKIIVDYNIILKDPSIASTEVIIQNKPIKAKYVIAEKNEKYIFTLKNPRNNKTIYFGFATFLYPLIEKSFEFMP